MIRTHVDLFSGIGGFSLACEWAGVETIAHAEIDDYASRVLKKHWPSIRNYGDVRNVPALDSVWLVTGGVPCQPASVAGKRRGAEDDRWLWPEALAVTERIRPAWVLFENPTGILSLNDGVEFERICLALEGQGYEVQPLVIPACAVGAPHKRDRVWIIAYTDSDSESNVPLNAREVSRGVETPDSNANSQRRQGGIKGLCAESPNGHGTPSSNSRALEFNGFRDGLPSPSICRANDGLPDLVDRLRCLGNAIVPQVAYRLIKRMIEAEEMNEVMK